MKGNVKGQFYHDTNIGRVRLNNEDRAIATINSSGDVLLLVCDGMGGQNKGDYASSLALNTVFEEFKNSKSASLFFLRKKIEKAIKKANTLIFNESESNPNYEGMGTTLIAALISKNKLVVFNVGDSRCYMLNKMGELIRLSEDQTVVEYLYNTGKISKTDTSSHPSRHVLMNALGIYPSLSLDIKTYDYYGESVLVCSDGLYNNVSEAELLGIISTKDNVDEKVNLLINQANLNGGSDNIGIAYWESNDD